MALYGYELINNKIFLMKLLFILYILFLCFKIINGKNSLIWYCIGICTLSNTFHIMGFHSQFLMSLCLFVRFCVASKLRNPLRDNPLKTTVIIWVVGIFLVSLFDYHESIAQKILATFRQTICTIFVFVSSFYLFNKMNSFRKFEQTLIICLITLTFFALVQFVTDINITQEIAVTYFSTDSSYTAYDMYAAKEYQASIGRMRIDSLLGFAFDYGFYSGALGLFSLYLYFRDKKIVYLCIGLLCGLGGGLLCGSRSALISVLGSYTILFLLHGRFNIIKLILPCIALVSFFVFFNELTIVQGLLDIFSSGGGNSVGSSRDMRSDQLIGSLYWFMQSPIFGNGFGFIENAAPDNAMKAMVMGSESLLFAILIQSGIVGFVYWFLFIVQSFGKLVQRKNGLNSQFGIALLVGFLLYSFATGVQGSIFITFPLIAYSLTSYKKLQKIK